MAQTIEVKNIGDKLNTLNSLKKLLAYYNPGFVQSKFFNLYDKIYNGASLSGEGTSIGTTQLNFAVFGDSVAGSKGYPLKDMLIASFGNRGSIYSGAATVSGNGYIHQNLTETDYWFTGLWHGVTGGSGTVTFQIGGSGLKGDKLKIYYIKGPGFGHFKVQKSINGLAGTYNDIAGYEDIDCSDTELKSAVLEIATTVTETTIPRITGVSGDVIVLFATMENTTKEGVMWLNMSAGGLGWDKASLTPSAIITPVFADLKIDLATLEFKEGSSHTWVSTYVYPWLNVINDAYTKTDWILIGSTPQTSSDEYNVSANSELKAYADTYDYFYFDGYYPFANYSKLTDIGWNGDGTHPSAKAGYFLAGIIYQLIGLTSLFKKPIGSDIRNSNIWSSIIKISGFTDGVQIGELTYDGDNDLVIKTKRNIVFKTISGTTRATMDGGNFNLGAATAKYGVNGVYGVSGSFTTNDGKTITVTNGIITSIV